MVSRVLVLLALALLAAASMAGPVPTADIETLRNFFGELPVQEKRLRGEPIRFGKRAPREPIRFGKRDDFPVDEDSYRLLFL